MARQHGKRRLTRGRALIGGFSAVALTAAALTTGSMIGSASASDPASASQPAAVSPMADWPSPSGDESVPETIQVDDSLDGGMTRYVAEWGDDGQDEGGDPVFELADGATLENVIIGAPGVDGVHCEGSCTLKNVWWEDVGEDAATFRGGDDATYTVSGGGARAAEDKVLQHNGGGTLTVTDFAVEDFGALYRSCGNCSDMYERHVVLDGIEASAPVGRLAGINVNYGDTATLRNITVIGDDEVRACVKYEGNDNGDEPEEVGEGPDGTNCLYDESDISYQ